MLTAQHRRAVRYSQAGNAAHLAACLAVRREMGGVKTLALAHDLARSVDTVERMGRAGLTYVALRKCSGQDKLRLAILRDARHQLYYTHFETLGRWWFKYEFSVDTAMNYLSDALEHRYSTRALDEAIAADYRTSRSVAAVVYPVWHLNDDTIERLRNCEPGARVVVVSGLDESVTQVSVRPVADNALQRAMGREA